MGRNNYESLHTSYFNLQLYSHLLITCGHLLNKLMKVLLIIVLIERISTISGFLQNGEMLYIHHKTNRTASTVPRSVGSDESTREVRRNACRTFLCSCHLPVCFITEQSTVEAVLFVK